MNSFLKNVGKSGVFKKWIGQSQNSLQNSKNEVSSVGLKKNESNIEPQNAWNVSLGCIKLQQVQTIDVNNKENESRDDLDNREKTKRQKSQSLIGGQSPMKHQGIENINDESPNLGETFQINPHNNIFSLRFLKDNQDASQFQIPKDTKEDKKFNTNTDLQYGKSLCKKKSFSPKKEQVNTRQSLSPQKSFSEFAYKLQNQVSKKNIEDTKKINNRDLKNELQNSLRSYSVNKGKKNRSQVGYQFCKSISIHSFGQEDNNLSTQKCNFVDCFIFLFQAISYLLVGIFLYLKLDNDSEVQESKQSQTLQNKLNIKNEDGMSSAQVGIVFIVSFSLQLLFGVILTYLITQVSQEKKQSSQYKRGYLLILSLDIMIQYESLIILMNYTQEKCMMAVMCWFFLFIFLQLQEFGNIIFQKFYNILFTSLLIIYFSIRIQLLELSVPAISLQIFLLIFYIAKKMHTLDIQFVEQNFIGQQQEILTGVKDFYNNMLNLLPQGIVVVDSNQELVYHNNSIIKLLQCQSENIIECLSNISTNQNEIHQSDNSCRQVSIKPLFQSQITPLIQTQIDKIGEELKYKSYTQTVLQKKSDTSESQLIQQNNINKSFVNNCITKSKNRGANVGQSERINEMNSSQNIKKSSFDVNQRIHKERNATIQKSGINISKHQKEINGNDQNYKISQLIQKLFNISQQDQSAIQAIRRVQTDYTKSFTRSRKSNVQQKRKQPNLHFSNDTIQVQINFNNKCLLLNLILCEFQWYEITESDVKIEPVILIMIEDISQQIQMKELEIKNQCKMRMLASVSHELRTPLNCSISLLEVLKNMISNELTQEYIEPALNSQHLLLNIINDILDFAQIDVGKFKFTFQYFDLKNIILNCIKLIELQTKIKQIKLICQFSDEVNYQFYSDPNRIRQIMLNLLSNALKFTQKGHIMIKVEKENETFTKITVKDTGIGIASEDIDKIFEIFGKIDLKNQNLLNTQGVGLGLSIASQLAKGLGQNRSIQVQSTLGKGSSFTFFLENKVQSLQKATNSIDTDQTQTNDISVSNSTRLQQIQTSPRSKINQEVKADSSINLFSRNIDQRQQFTNQKQLSQLTSSSPNNNNNSSYFNDNNIKPVLFTSSQQPSLYSRARLSLNDQQQNLNQVITKTVCPYEQESQKLDDTFNADQYTNRGSQFPQHLMDRYSQFYLEDNANITELEDEDSHQQVNENNVIQIRLKDLSQDLKQIETPCTTQSSIISYNNAQYRDKQNYPSYDHLQKTEFTLNSNSICITTDRDNTLLLNQTLLKEKTKQIISKLTKCTCPPILIVDDNEFNRYVLQKLLLSYNLQVDQACNGQVAIDRVFQRYCEITKADSQLLEQEQKSQQQPSSSQKQIQNKLKKCCYHYKIIFMDIDMPIKNGYQAAKEINNFYTRNKIQQLCPIIVACTAFVGQQERQQCESFGMDYFLTKPISSQIFDNLLLDIFEKQLQDKNS